MSILRCILKKSRVILLDEPVSSLDDDNSQKVFTLLKAISKKKLVIVSSHAPLPEDIKEGITINLHKGELTSFVVVNKEVYETKIEEEQDEFKPPKKVVLSSFFKEVFRSLFLKSKET